MECTYQDCITNWVAHILRADVSFSDIKQGNVLVDLTKLTGDTEISSDLSDPDNISHLITYLDGNYQFRASDLFSVKDVVEGKADDDEVLGLCLLILITCLQSRAKQLFMDAALTLDFETQTVIFHLLREPMTQLSADQRLTRDCVLAGFHEPIPSPQSLTVQADILNHCATVCSSTLVIPEQNELEVTPIKPINHHMNIRQSWCGTVDRSLTANFGDLSSDQLYRSWTAGDCANPISSSPIDDDKIKTGDTVFRIPRSTCPKKLNAPERSASSQQAARSRTTHVNPVSTDFAHDTDDHYATCLHSGDLEYNRMHVHQDPLRPVSPLSARSQTPNLLHDNSRPRRPNNLPLHVFAGATQFSHHPSTPPVTTSLGDFTDSLYKQCQQPITSPLTYLKHVLDSPLWRQKARLRETERERRYLSAQLLKELAYKDEVEHVVAELRKQLDEARIRVTEAESKSARMSRELTALQDQTDELSVCRTELALREDEITSLKQRLNSFQDLLLHSRKLELENANLRQECADSRQKVDQLSAKLSEVKDRQLVYTEVESLRSKLRDAEAKLAQLLSDSEKAEKDARRQHELYNQLKLQHALAVVRRDVNERHSDHLNYPTQSQSLVAPKPNSVPYPSCTANEIDFDVSLASEDVANRKPSVDSIQVTKPSLEISLLKIGENLGSILETELQSAQSQLIRLQTDLDDATNKLSMRDATVLQLTERLNQLTSDMAALSVQRELAEQSARQAQDCLSVFRDDLATVEGRILWLCSTQNATGGDCPNVQLQHPVGLLGQLRNVGVGVSEPLDRFVHVLAGHFEKEWKLQSDKLESTLKLLSESRDEIRELTEAVSLKDQATEKTLQQFREHTSEHECLQTALRSSIDLLERERVGLQTQLEAQLNYSKQLDGRLQSLESDKDNMEDALAEHKRQAEMELCTVKQMLDTATNKVHDLEAELMLKNFKSVQVDMGTQTNDPLFELPLTLIEAESLEHLDGEAWPNEMADDDNLSHLHGLSHSALEALAADRRGLSDELLRLHNELDDSNAYLQQLLEHNTELEEKLATTETALEQQSTLLNRAQHNWTLVERKYRETEECLKQTRTEHAFQLEAVRAELIPQLSRSHSEASATAAHADIVRCKYAAEKEQMNHRLCELTSELENVSADRNRLAERNRNLQRELLTTRNLVGTIFRSQPPVQKIPSRRRHSGPNPSDGASISDHNPDAHANSLLEEWVKCTQIKNRQKVQTTNTTIPEHSDEPSDSSDYSSIGASPPNGNERTNMVHLLNSLVSHRHSCVSEVHKEPRFTMESRKMQPHSITEEIARLSTRTAMLESFALALSQHKHQIQTADQPSGVCTTQPRTLVPSLVALTNTLPLLNEPCDPTTGEQIMPHSASFNLASQSLRQFEVKESPASAPVPLARRPVERNGHELDTDADSSAYTDLSQVSPVSRNSLRLMPSVSAGAGHSSPISTNRSHMSRSQGLRKSDPPQSSRTTERSLCTDNCHFSKVSNYAPTKCVKEDSAENLTNPDRISELHRRNRLQPMHLRTSYPVETQTAELEHIADAFCQLSSAGLQNDPINMTKIQQSEFRQPVTSPLSNVSEENNILREMGEANHIQEIVPKNISSLRDRPMCSRVATTIDCSSPLAAGYQRRPQNLQDITDALIAASYDSSALADALTNELARVSLKAPNAIKSVVNRRLHPRNQSGKASIQCSSHDVFAPSHRPFIAAASSNSTTSTSRSHPFVDDNYHPSLVTHHHEIEFVRPLTPPRSPNSQTYESQHGSIGASDDSLSFTSSIRSHPKSTAFEIPNEPVSGRPRRLLAPRMPRSTKARPVPTQPKTIVISMSHNPMRLNRAKPSTTSRNAMLSTQSTFPNNESFRALETPLLRNPRCLN